MKKIKGKIAVIGNIIFDKIKNYFLKEILLLENLQFCNYLQQINILKITLWY